MKTTFFCLVYFLNLFGCTSQIKDDYPIELAQLAKKENMELVYGEKFPYLNPFGSYGSPAVFDFIYESGTNINRSVLFLCRKRKVNAPKDKDEKIIDLVINYDYFLFFAVKKKGENRYQKKSIIKDVQLKGMYVDCGFRFSEGLQLSNFYYLYPESGFLESDKLKVPKNITASTSDNCMIIMSADSSTLYLYYYKGKWLFRIERDW